jgi:hypothetical protein
VSKENIISVIKGAGIAAIGAVLTYAAQWTANTDFGQWTPFVVATLSVITNLFRKSIEAK